MTRIGSKLDAIQGQHYQIVSMANNPRQQQLSAFMLKMGQPSLPNLLHQGFGKNTRLVWTSSLDQVVYIRLRHLNGQVIGNDVSTTVSVQEAEVMYLPVVNR
jgi:hypothetical protein